MKAPVAVLGAGAFGSALAMIMADNGRRTTLWGRPGATMSETIALRENRRHLAGLRFPDDLVITDRLDDLPGEAVVLLSVPTQNLRNLLETHRDRLAGHVLIACCKGIERSTGQLPTEVIQSVLPGARCGVLTGPSFAMDLASGRPTALTFATRDPEGRSLQALLSTPNLRLYLNDDPVGAQLGGALKNVIAIAAGVAIGAGLGESARSALMTRGFAEMSRFASGRGAQRDTLFGLSGFGDLVLTCTSTLSRNLRHGIAVGAGNAVESGVTVEGVVTAHAVAESESGMDMPVTKTVSMLLKQELNLREAMESLLSRPLRRETHAS